MTIPTAPKPIRRAAGLILAAFGLSLPGCGPGVQVAEDPKADGYVLRHTATAIDGETVNLERYRGQVVLIVNTASRCGFTGQYATLEELYTSRREQGLVVLGFPSNDFMGQEPGSNKEIAEFCSTRFGVTFPMFEKIAVKGESADPLYGQLSDLAGPPAWNFNKYLVDRDGTLVARFDSRVKPTDPELAGRIDELLDTPPKG